MTAADYLLMQELRLSATKTNCARAQLWTLREPFLNLGASGCPSASRGASLAAVGVDFKRLTDYDDSIYGNYRSGCGRFIEITAGQTRAAYLMRR